MLDDDERAGAPPCGSDEARAATTGVRDDGERAPPGGRGRIGGDRGKESLRGKESHHLVHSYH